MATMFCLSKPLFECKNSFCMQDDNTDVAALMITAVQMVQPLCLNFDGDVD